MLISLHEHFPVRVTDWLLSAMLFSWGGRVLFMDPAVWALPTYSGLNDLADQYTWGAVALCLGLMRLGALVVNGAVRPSPHLRLAGAFLAIFIWVQLSLGMMFSETTGAEVSIIPFLAFADMFNVYRAAQDARVADTKAKQRRRAVAASAERT
jgi:hypothetical protein